MGDERALEALREGLNAPYRSVQAHCARALGTLGAIETFPPAQILWNAGHADVPLHCFFRSKIEPVFRITRLEIQPPGVRLRWVSSMAFSEEMRFIISLLNYFKRLQAQF